MTDVDWRQYSAAVVITQIENAISSGIRSGWRLQTECY